MSLFFSLSLFFLSFAPLWLSVLFIDALSIHAGDSPLWTEKIGIFCILVGMLASAYIVSSHLEGKTQENTKRQTVLSQKKEKSITSEFLLSYVLPLFAFDFTVWNETVLFLIFFFTLAALCAIHREFSANVVLELAGYRFYRCTLRDDFQNETEQIVVSKSTLAYSVGSVITVKSINNDYSLVACVYKNDRNEIENES